MTNLTIAGETFHVRIEGEETNPVLMLSNSLGTTLRMWEPQMPALLKHFRVIRYDSRGHGGSVVSPGPYSIAQLGRDALAILDALEIDRVHWLGLSKGGAVGQWLLINAPDRIERAVLANTAAQFGQPDGWNSRITAVLEGGMAGLADWIMQRWFGGDFLESHDPHLEQIRKDVLATPARGYAACCAALRDTDLREGLRDIEHPVLVIAGAHDPATTTAQTGLIASAVAQAKLVTLDTHHISNIEDAEGFTKAVLDFLLAKTSARRAPTRKMMLPPPLPAARRGASRRIAARGQTSDAMARRPATAQASAATAGAGEASATKPKAARPTAIPKKAGKAAPKKNAALAAPAKPARKPARKAVDAKKPPKAAAKTAAKAVAKPVQKAAAPTKPPQAKTKAKTTAKPAPAAKSKPVSKAAPAKATKAKTAAKSKPAAKTNPASKIRTPATTKTLAKAPKRPVKRAKKPAPRGPARAVNRK